MPSMHTGMTRQTGQARLAFSAVVCLALSGASAAAQQAGALASAPAPGKVVEVTALAQTVVETIHYQAELVLSCSPLTCSADFPRPGAKRRVNVTRVTCILRATAGSAAAGGSIALRKADFTHLLYQWLPTQHSSPDGFHTLNRAVDMQIASNQHIRVAVSLASGTAASASCTASGTLEKLQ